MVKFCVLYIHPLILSENKFKLIKRICKCKKTERRKRSRGGIKKGRWGRGGKDSAG